MEAAPSPLTPRCASTRVKDGEARWEGHQQEWFLKTIRINGEPGKEHMLGCRSKGEAPGR